MVYFTGTNKFHFHKPVYWISVPCNPPLHSSAAGTAVHHVPSWQLGPGLLRNYHKEEVGASCDPLNVVKPGNPPAFGLSSNKDKNSAFPTGITSMVHSLFSSTFSLLSLCASLPFFLPSVFFLSFSLSLPPPSFTLFIFLYWGLNSGLFLTRQLLYHFSQVLFALVCFLHRFSSYLFPA
jgi:hypothetical protein